MTRRIISSLIFAVLSLTVSNALALTPSTIGWFNVFVPGGGEFIQGHPLLGAEQAALEVSMFGVGFSLSAKSPLTLDGVPEDIPTPHHNIFQTPQRHCQTINGKQVCTTTTAPGNGTVNYKIKDIQKAMIADALQEIGIKAHMINIYDSYRTAIKDSGLEYGFVDQTPTGELFLAPIRIESVFSSEVIYPLIFSALYEAYSFATEDRQAISPLNTRSKIEYGLAYGAMYPLGSGAAEEMFYRGFVQNEVYRSTDSRWISVLVSTAAYTISHSSDAYIGAAASGIYLGALTFHEKGQLSKGIAFHFWSDVIGGVHAILSLQRNQVSTRPAAMSMSMEF